MKPWEMEFVVREKGVDDRSFAQNGEQTTDTAKKPWEMGFVARKKGVRPVSVAGAKPQHVFSVDGWTVDTPSRLNKVMNDAGQFFLSDMPLSDSDRSELASRQQGTGEEFFDSPKNYAKDAVVFGESIGKSVAKGVIDQVGSLGSFVSWFGDNMIVPENHEWFDKNTIDRLNTFGKLWQKAGQTLRSSADFVLKSKDLELDPVVFSGAFQDNPSLTRAASAFSSALPSLMGTLGLYKLTKSPALAYFITGGIDSSDIYEASKQAGHDLDKTNLLYGAGMAGTALIDRVLNPIESVLLTKTAGKSLWRRLADKIMGGLIEGSAEGAQTIWQNAIKKYGIDDTQGLMNGVIESIIGGFGAGAVMTGALDTSANALKNKGATQKEIDHLIEASGRYVQQHADELNDIVFQQADQGLSRLEAFIQEYAGTPEAQKALKTKAELEEVGRQIKDRLIKAGRKEDVAIAESKVFQGIALWGSEESGLSPLEYITQRSPHIRQVKFEEFKKRFEEKRSLSGTEDVNLFEALLNPDVLRGVKKADKGQSLLQFIKSRGGLKDVGGELKAMDAGKQYIGLINNKSGNNLDDMTLSAWENGYFQNHTERPDIDDLLDKVRQELSGDKIYAFDNKDNRSLHDDVAELAEVLDMLGIDYQNMSAKEAEQAYDEAVNSRQQDDSVYDRSDEAYPIDDDIFSFEDEFIPFQYPQKNIKSTSDRGKFSESNNIYWQGQITDSGALSIDTKEEMQGLSEEEFKDKMLETLKGFKGKRIYNTSLGGDIEIRTSSIKKYKSFFADKNKRLIVPYIPKLLEKAKFVNESTYTPETEKNVRAYWKSDIAISIDDNNFDVHLTVKEDDKGNLFWDAQVKEKARRTVSATNPSVGGLTPEISEDTLSITPVEENVKTFFQESMDVAIKNEELDAKYPAYEGETIDINGKERPVYNSDGVRIVKSAEALRNFYNWFRDSDAVDTKGRPMVFYTGSPAKNIEVFDYNKIGQTGTAEGAGFYFTNQKEQAEGYTGRDGRVYPVYLKVGKSLSLDSHKLSREDMKNILKSAAIAQSEEYGEEVKEGFLSNYGVYSDDVDYMVDVAVDMIYSEDKTDNDMLQEAMAGVPPQFILEATVKETGYDAIKTQGYGDRGKSDNTFYVIFTNTQIKSAENRGTFNPNERNIYWQSALSRKTIQKAREVKEALQKIADGSEEETVKDLRDDLDQYGGTNDVTFVYGNDKKGIVHIAQNHGGIKTLLKVLDAVVDGDVVRYSDVKKTVVLEKDGYEAVLSLDEHGQKKTWLLTGWDKKISPDAEREFSATLKATQQMPTFSRQELGAGLTYFSVTPNSDHVKGGYQERIGKKANGAYADHVIWLFEGANESSFMHETAHWFKEELASFNTDRSKAMLKKVDEWEQAEFDRRYKIELYKGRYVVQDLKGHVVFDQNFGTADQAKNYAKNELFARGFEQYLKQGKAPNNYLKQAFHSFWRWLRHLYKTADRLNVTINDDVRRVYDDILGGEDLDFYLNEEPVVFLKRHEQKSKDRLYLIDDEINKAVSNYKHKSWMGELSEERRAGRVGLKDMWERAIIPLSTRLKRISDHLHGRLREYEYTLAKRENETVKELKPMLTAWNNMTQVDRIRFDLALKNGHTALRDQILDQYGCKKNFEAVTQILERLYHQAEQAGVDMGYLPDYFPRTVDDAEGLLIHLYGEQAASDFERAKKKAGFNDMSLEEQDAWTNKWLRGYGRVDMRPTAPGYTKERGIDVVTAELNPYYKDSLTSLLNYVDRMTKLIASREFFGSSAHEDIDESIGSFVNDLVNKGEIRPADMKEVESILRARFKARGVSNKGLHFAKNMAYVYTMGGINSALIQLEDLSNAILKGGLGNTLSAIVRKNKLTREDLGVSRIAQEFEDAARSSKIVEGLFKISGLDKMDAFGKNVFINAVLNKYKKMRDSALKKRLQPYLGDKTDQTVKDIKNGQITDDVKLALFNELSDVQPITLSEMPEYFNTGGNMRIMYMLKSFTVKRLDFFRNDCFDKIRNGHAAEGVYNLTRMAAVMILCGMSVDKLIDWLYGRNVDLSETFINRLVGLFGVTKYQLYKARDEGVPGIVGTLIPPVFSAEKDLMTDVMNSLLTDKKKDVWDYEVWKGIPLIGRFYYWHLGGGQEKMKRKNKRKRKQKRKTER